ncbi:MAG: Na/Pi cotransporter family protein, partial [Roseinatronobacter sp.]|nr:Na/Pi cotransporter family protein [Roseinatronobacter sp.]
PAPALTRVQELRDAAGALVRAVKAVKHMRENVQRFTTADMGEISHLYDTLRTELAHILVEIERLEATDPAARSALWIAAERRALAEGGRRATRTVEAALQTRRITASDATSFLNDSSYAFESMHALLDAAQLAYRPEDKAEAEIERLLELDEDEDENKGQSEDHLS